MNHRDSREEDPLLTQFKALKLALSLRSQLAEIEPCSARSQLEKSISTRIGQSYTPHETGLLAAENLKLSALVMKLKTEVTDLQDRCETLQVEVENSRPQVSNSVKRNIWSFFR